MLGGWGGQVGSGYDITLPSVWPLLTIFQEGLVTCFWAALRPLLQSCWHLPCTDSPGSSAQAAVPPARKWAAFPERWSMDLPLVSPEEKTGSEDGPTGLGWAVNSL